MSAPLPRFVIVRASAAILGILLVGTGAFFVIHYFQRQSERLDMQEAQREEIAGGTRVGGNNVNEGKRITQSPKRAPTPLRQIERPPGGESETQKAVALAKQREEDYGKIYAELDAAGMVRSATLPTPESIAARKEILGRLEAANLALVDALNAMRENALVEYRKQGLSDRDGVKALASSSSGAPLDALIATRAVDRELISYFQQLLDLLESDWGAWKPDAGDKVLFDQQSEANRYNALRRRIVEASNRQHALQKLAETKPPTPAPSTPRPAMRYDPGFIGPPSDGEFQIERPK